MIFGRNHKEQRAVEQENILCMAHGIKGFAFLPMILDDGRIIWLSFYYEFWPVKENPHGEFEFAELDCNDNPISHLHETNSINHAIIIHKEAPR